MLDELRQNPWPWVAGLGASSVLAVGVAVWLQERVPPLPPHLAIALSTARRQTPWRKRQRTERLVQAAAREDGIPGLVELHAEIQHIAGARRETAEALIRCVVDLSQTVRRHDLAAPVDLQMEIYDWYQESTVEEGYPVTHALVEAAKQHTASDLLSSSPQGLRHLLRAVRLGLVMALVRGDYAAFIDERCTAREESGRLAAIIEVLQEAARSAPPAIAGMVHAELDATEPQVRTVLRRISDTDADGHLNLGRCVDTERGYSEVHGQA
jgi:hypothetical protein